MPKGNKPTVNGGSNEKDELTTFLFTSESVGEGHPGRLPTQQNLFITFILYINYYYSSLAAFRINTYNLH